MDNTSNASAAVQSTYSDGALAGTVTDLGSSAAKTNLYGLHIENNDAANAVYLQFFDGPASGVTLGTTAPAWTVQVPKGAIYDLAPIRALKYFDAGLSVACTTTRTGSTGVTTKPTCTFYYSQS